MSINNEIVDELNSKVCVIFKDAEEERLFYQIAQEINYGTRSEIKVDELDKKTSKVCVIFKDAEEERLFYQIAQDINYDTHSELQEKANVLCKRKKCRRSK